MKLEEMSDVLDGLAATLEKVMGKTAINDFHTLAACLRKFPGETVGAFCNIAVQAHEGKPSGRTKTSTNGAKVDEVVGKIQHFLNHRQEFDYSAIRQMIAGLDKMKVPDIKTVGERVGCPLRERTKSAMLSSLESWMSNIKLSMEQSSFSLAEARNRSGYAGHRQIGGASLGRGRKCFPPHGWTSVRPDAMNLGARPPTSHVFDPPKRTPPGAMPSGVRPTTSCVNDPPEGMRTPTGYSFPTNSNLSGSGHSACLRAIGTDCIVSQIWPRRHGTRRSFAAG